MKLIKYLLIVTIVISAAINTNGQTPQFINYQAVARDAAGGIITMQPVSVRLTIRDGSTSGTAQYQETQNITTNIYGLFSLQIGSGTVAGGAFNAITWNTGNKYLQVEIDPTGGSSFVDMGTQQLVSVPYSLFAASANSASTLSGNVTMGGDISGTNSAATISKLQGNTVTAGSPAGRQVLKWNGTAWTPANDSVNTYSAGTGLTLAGTVFSAQNTTALWNANKLQGDSVSTAAPASGQVLQWIGTAWAPTAIAGGVTSITAGSGLSGGTITTSGSISMPGVGTAGTYGSATQVPVLTTDAQGRVTGVTNTTITGPTYTAGTGIGISGTTITNTAPDQTVTITAGAGISVTGTYPNFTIINTGGGIPAGSIMAFGGDSASVPTGWLLCNGLPYGTGAYPALFAAIGTNYGGSGGIFYIPDFRGRFLRGADLSANNDPDHAVRTAMNAGGNTGNNVGSVQVDTFKSHTHTSNSVANIGSGISGGCCSGSVGATINPTGGTETRPKNAYVNYIIKY